MNPEQIKQEQERVLKPLEKYETLLAEYEREDEAYWLQDDVLSKPYPRRLEAKRRQLERLREELNDSLTPTLARQYADLLDAHLALHAQLAQAEEREALPDSRSAWLEALSELPPRTPADVTPAELRSLVFGVQDLRDFAAQQAAPPAPASAGATAQESLQVQPTQAGEG